jgi:hypothetical protein
VPSRQSTRQVKQACRPTSDGNVPVERYSKQFVISISISRRETARVQLSCCPRESISYVFTRRGRRAICARESGSYDAFSIATISKCPHFFQPTPKFSIASPQRVEASSNSSSSLFGCLLVQPEQSQSTVTHLESASNLLSNPSQNHHLPLNIAKRSSTCRPGYLQRNVITGFDAT